MLCRRRTSGASSRYALPKPSTTAPSSMPRSSRTCPAPSPATATFHGQIQPRGHGPPAWIHPRTLWLRGALHIFLSFSTPEWERHTKKASHPKSSENTPMYPLKQSEHTRHASRFLRFDSHATHASTLQPAAMVFVSYGFALPTSSLVWVVVNNSCCCVNVRVKLRFGLCFFTL